MKYQRLLGFLWLGLLLGAAVFCILWGRVPTKDAQTYLNLDPVPPDATLPVIAISVPVATPAVSAPVFTVPPTPSPTPVPTATPDPRPFSIFWYSDTQYYSYKHPEIFRKMTDWSVQNAGSYNALCVVHTGDIVDNHKYERHWHNAASALSTLKGHLPLYCVAGNHDVGAETVDYTAYRSASFCNVLDAKRVWENGIAWVQPLERQRILLVGIGWQKDAPYLDWVLERLAEYPDYTAILLVHSFLEDNGTLTPNGKLLEQQLLPKATNLRLILCGHKDGSVRWQKTYDDNTRTVNALMYNFQDDKKKGLGYLRILSFDPVARTIDVTTYSPYLDDYNYYAEESLDTFTLFNAF